MVADGSPLGIVTEAEFVDQVFVLRDGDFTDDVLEVRRCKGEFYRFEGMCSPLSGNRARIRCACC